MGGASRGGDWVRADRLEKSGQGAIAVEAGVGAGLVGEGLVGGNSRFRMERGTLVVLLDH